MRRLSKADLFDYERFIAILGFRLGLYEHWRESYIASMKEGY